MSTLNSNWVLQATRVRRRMSRCATCATRRMSQRGASQHCSSRLTVSPTAWSRKKCTHRDEHHAPLPGVAGDLARSCDEQLLDAFLAIKRIIDERSELIERSARGLDSEEVDEDVYDESTDGEDGDAEPAERTGGAMGDEAEPLSEAYPSDDDAPAPPTAVSGGGDCDQSSDQQGHVLPYNHPPELLCLTEGCNRRRRRYF